MIGRLRRNAELGLILLGVVITGWRLHAGQPRAARPRSRPTSARSSAIVLALLRHRPHRRSAGWRPSADGMLLPVAALLNGLGYVFIARLSRPSQNLAGLQATWTAVGIAGVHRHAARRAPGPRPRALPLHVRRCSGSGCWCCRSCRASGVTIFGSRIWVRARSDQLPARRVRQDRAGHLLRVVPRREARAARHGDVADGSGRCCPTPSTSARCCSPGGVAVLVMTAEKDLGRRCCSSPSSS